MQGHTAYKHTAYVNCDAAFGSFFHFQWQGECWLCTVLCSYTIFVSNYHNHMWIAESVLFECRRWHAVNGKDNAPSETCHLPHSVAQLELNIVNGVVGFSWSYGMSCVKWTIWIYENVNRRIIIMLNDDAMNKAQVSGKRSKSEWLKCWTKMRTNIQMQCMTLQSIAAERGTINFE